MSRKLVAVSLAVATWVSGGVALAQAPNVAPLTGGPPIIPNRVFVVEQVMTAKLPVPLLQQLRPLKTLRQVEELLKANSIPFAWRKVELNSATVPPAIMGQIEAMPPGEVFVIPNGENLTMNVIIGERR